VSRPTVSPVAERVYTALAPFTEQDEAYGWPLLRFCDALTVTAADVETFAADTDTAPGWSVLLDPTVAPARALPYLGQMVGVVVPAAADEATARAMVLARAGWGRGTPFSVLATVRLHLTGSKTASLTERDGSAYRVTVTVYALEVPDVDAVTAAFNAALPAGIVGTVEVLSGWTFAEAHTRYPTQTFAQVQAIWAGETFARVSQEVP
jgi:hypothetical protein